MTLTLTPELTLAIETEARRRGATAEDVAQTALHERFLPQALFADGKDTLSEWEQEIGTAAAQVESVSAQGQQ